MIGGVLGSTPPQSRELVKLPFLSASFWQNFLKFSLADLQVQGLEDGRHFFKVLKN